MNEATESHRVFMQTARRDDVPIVESPGGSWRRLEGWMLNEFSALKRLLRKHNFYGQMLDDALRDLHVAGLNMPPKFDTDAALLAEWTGNPKAYDLFCEELRDILCNV